MTDDLPHLYSLKQVAERTGFALRTLERDCRADRIEHVHRGRERLMTAAQVTTLIGRHTRTPEPDIEEIIRATTKATGRDYLDRIMAREKSPRGRRRV